MMRFTRPIVLALALILVLPAVAQAGAWEINADASTALVIAHLPDYTREWTPAAIGGLTFWRLFGDSNVGKVGVGLSLDIAALKVGEEAAHFAPAAAFHFGSSKYQGFVGGVYLLNHGSGPSEQTQFAPMMGIKINGLSLGGQ